VWFDKFSLLLLLLPLLLLLLLPLLLLLLLLLLLCQVFTFRDMSQGVKSNVRSIGARGGKVRQLVTSALG
jgi:hypothetical protein